MGALREWLKGKKTYILAGMAAATAVLNYLFGDSGLANTIWEVLAALGLGTLRAGVSNGSAPEANTGFDNPTDG